VQALRGAGEVLFVGDDPEKWRRWWLGANS
jgi:hypothetical protein